MKKIFTSIFVLLVLGAWNAQTYWTNLNSPNNCSYYAVSHDGNKIWANNGILGNFGELHYKQGAAPFSTVAVTINSTTAVNNILCLVNGDLVVTGSQSFTVPVVYRSTDNGTTWTQSTATITGFNQNIIQDAAANVYVYNYAAGSPIVKSTDNGATFANVSGTFAVKGLAVTGNTLFACGTNGGWNIWKSTDGAVTWSLMPNNASQGNQNNIYATPNGNVYFSDYKSTDGGNTWVQMTAPPSGSGVYMVDRLNNIYVKDEPTNLFKSSDAGATYTNVVTGLNWSPTISAQRKIATNDGKLYFSTIGAPNYSLYVHQTGTINAVSEISAQSNQLDVFPVPANDQFNLVIENGSISQISIFDQNGKAVYSNNLVNQNEVTVSTENFANGIYLVKIQNSEGFVLTKKIVISK
ncbi:MAG: T9SS type A sorting domain-containing protein [Sphingobacteriaceae bacterium]|nr:T9SS type A sorting domain-containing protein [Sphingobacteriaceae bacterium]